VIGVFAPLFPPAKLGGGPIRTLEALVASAPAEFEQCVLTGDHDLGAMEPLPVRSEEWSQIGAAQVYYASNTSIRGALRGLTALRSRRPELLYFNGFFDAQFSVLPQLLWRVGFWGRAMRLVAPRGEFGAGALSRRSAKKQAYVRLFRMLRLHRQVFWHASSELEAADIRRVWGDASRIVVRENETLLPERARPASQEGTEAEPAPLRAAFLGRVVAHKGLHIALEALAGVEARVDFDVCGPLEDPKYVARCRALIEALPEQILVRLHGPLESEDTRDTLARFDVLLMPTAGENFGHVIAESLSVSCPVVCSPHTPWTATLESGGGVVLPLTAAAWTREVERRAVASPNERLDERHRAGQAYDQWRAKPSAPHVFELLEQRRAASASARAW
jgi:Glycosyltransferase